MAAKVEVDIFANDRTGGVLGKINSGLGSILTTAAGFITGQLFMQAGAAITDFATSSISAASNLNETISKSKQIFGESSAELLKWSEASATSFGLSKGAALDAASGFAVFGKAAGLAGGELVDFAEENVGLAADLASFYNTTSEEAATAITAAFRGETEPIRKYGIMLDDATMRQEALALGIVSTTKEALTPQQKVLAAQSLMFKQTGDAQGDFARTSDGLANQQRILAAQLENTKTQLGDAFLPVITKAMTFINTVGIPALMGIIDAFKNWSFLNDTVIPWVSGVIDKLGGLGSFTLEGTPLGNALNALKIWWDTHGPTITKAVTDMRDAFADSFDRMGVAISDFVEQNLNKLVLWMDHNGARVEGFFEKLALLMENYVAPSLAASVEYILGLLDVSITNILGWGEILLSVIDGDWGNALDTLGFMFREAFNQIWGVVKLYLNLVLAFFGTTLDDVIKKIKETPVYQAGVQIMQGLWKGVSDTAAGFVNYVGELAASIVRTINGALGIQSPSKVMFDTGKNIMLGLRNGMDKYASLPVNMMANVTPGLISGIGMPAMASASAGAYGNVIINVDARDSMVDERWFATKFKTGVVQIMRDTGVSFRG